METIDETSRLIAVDASVASSSDRSDTTQPHHVPLQQHGKSPSLFETILERAEEVVEEFTTFEELDLVAIEHAVETQDIDELEQLVPAPVKLLLEEHDVVLPDEHLVAETTADDHADHADAEVVVEVEPPIPHELDPQQMEQLKEQVEHIVHPDDPFGPLAATMDGSTKLGLVPLIVLIFYNVSGGPFGIESSVRSAGPGLALLGFALAPLVWALPEALMTAELGTTFPEASGGVAWVEEAFGVNAAWFSGYWGWVAGATDNAIYPVLFLDYVVQASASSATTTTTTTDDSEQEATNGLGHLQRFALLALVSISLGYINWRGLALVGHLSVSICFVAMSPFVILIAIGAFQIEPSRWLQGPSKHVHDVPVDGLIPTAAWGGVLWRPFLNNLFWNLNSFDAAGSFAADIQNPSTVLPKALMWAVFLSALSYLLPLAVALGATDSHPREWVDGYLTKVATEVGGPWLGAYTVLAAGISNIGLFQAELSADAFQLMGMADRGHLPRIFSTRSRHGTPTYGIVLGTLVIVAMGVSHLDQLIEMLNFNYSLSLLMEYAAFLKLRFAQPDLERPYRIPLGNLGCVLFMAPPILLTAFLLALASYQTYAFCVGVNVVGFAIYYARSVQMKSHVEPLVHEDPVNTSNGAR